MAIKVSRVLKESEERKAAGPPLPRVKSSSNRPAFPVTQVQIAEPIREAGPGSAIRLTNTPKDVILKDLYDQLAQVKRDRSVLASENAPMITRIHEHLKTESRGAAEEFIKGNLPMPELAEHYHRLLALTDRAIRLWDQVRHVEKYGQLPGVQEAVKESTDEGALKHRLRTLNDAISKTHTKLKVGKANNPSRIMLWEEKVAMLEVERSEVQKELKQLQLNVRNGD